MNTCSALQVPKLDLQEHYYSSAKIGAGHYPFSARGESDSDHFSEHMLSNALGPRAGPVSTLLLISYQYITS